MACEPKGDVYIPLCDKDRCIEQLCKLSKALEEKKLTCVVEDQIVGTFERWFREAFENCSYTIIHRCSHLWDKINTFESKFSDDDMKVMAVDLSAKVRNRNSMTRSTSGLSNFFNKFSTTNISDEKSLNAFVLKVVKLCRGANGQTKEPPDVKNQQPHKDSLMLLQSNGPGKDTAEEDADIFKAYPDLFGLRTHVFLQEDCVTYMTQEIAKYSQFKLEDWAEWQTKIIKYISEDKYTPRMKCIIYRTLPALYDGQKAIELAFIASCCESSLQGEAMLYLETMILSSKSGDKQISFSTQAFIETILFEKLTLKSEEMDAFDEDKDAAVLTERLCVLYVMVLSDMIISCRNVNEMEQCDIYFSTIIARNTKFQKAAYHLHAFIKDANKKSCFQMKKIISTYMKPDTANLGAQLSNETSAIQTCVILETMKQIFKSRNVNQLKLLCDYMKCQIEEPDKKIAEQYTRLTLMFRCLTIFLTFGLKNSKHQDLQDIYNISCEIIRAYLKWGLTEDMFKFMQILLFYNNPVIQKSIFKSESCVDGSIRCGYNKDQLPFLMNHVEKLLSPLLFVERNELDKPERKIEDQWKLMKAKFNGHDVLIHVHIPVVRSHRDENETGCTDDFYSHEMKVLQKLQHKNIIKMFAFQDNHVPLFYVVESIQFNLQTALKHKRENKDFYQQAILFKFLADALSAVEYCHSKLHVHCNLTSESVMIVNDKMAKLCGFNLCLELVDGRGKIDKKNSKKARIPTRWSAPESLSETEYTTASDVWMFGHLMHEVLTHGELPYSHIVNIDDVSKKIIGGTISLTEHPSFKNEHYDLICKCTAFSPDTRFSITQIKMQLNQFLYDSENTPSSQTSVYSSDSVYKQSTENEKGIPDLSSSKFIEDQDPEGEYLPVDISDTLIRLTNADVYIFREKIVHGVPPSMEIKVEDGKLSDIFPGIHIYQHRDEAHHIECSIPKTCQSLLEVVFERTLGSSLKPYLKCLLQVAFLLKKLHERSWILGDMCASYLYIEQTAQDAKVYVVSLANLLPCEQKDATCIRNPPENTHVCARAAPEVIKGMFSSRSDIYCFGYLMWEVLTAFDHLQENVEQFHIHIESTHTTKDEEYKQKVSETWKESHPKPHCCSDSLFELILSCTVSASVKRISLDKLIPTLQSICEDLTDERALENSAETTA